jgi:hypothetical protein
MFLLRGECRGHAGCARDVEFAAIPHIIAKSAKYPSVMGTATGYTMMFTACLPHHSQNPTRTNRSPGLIRNSYLLNKQMIIDNSCLGLANTQCFQKKISGRGKHNATSRKKHY